jgi:hypothetical protein
MRFIITGLLLIASLWVLWTHQPPWAFALYVCSWVLVGIINAEREYRIAQRLYERECEEIDRALIARLAVRLTLRSMPVDPP